MVNVKMVGLADRPAADKSHVIIEAASSGFRTSGISVIGQNVEALSPTTWHNYMDALQNASAWATTRRIRHVFVIADSGRGVVATSKMNRRR